MVEDPNFADNFVASIDTTKVKTTEERIPEWYIESKIINSRVAA